MTFEYRFELNGFHFPARIRILSGFRGDLIARNFPSFCSISPLPRESVPRWNLKWQKISSMTSLLTSVYWRNSKFEPCSNDRKCEEKKKWRSKMEYRENYDRNFLYCWNLAISKKISNPFLISTILFNIFEWIHLLKQK